MLLPLLLLLLVLLLSSVLVLPGWLEASDAADAAGRCAAVSDADVELGWRFLLVLLLPFLFVLLLVWLAKYLDSV